MKKKVLSIILVGFMICQSITAYGAEFTDSTEIEYEQNEETNMEDDIVQDYEESDDFTDGQPNAEQETDIAVFEDAETDDNSEILIDDNDEEAYNATANELTSGNYKYVVLENEATMTRYTGTESYVKVPEKIDGYTVRKIGKYAFRTCERMEKIEIPDSVTDIGEEAFRECRNLKEVVGGRKLQKLGGWVFEECKNLEKITLSSTLTEIGTGIFLGCEKLKTAGPETGEYNVKIGFSGNIPDRPFAGSRIESIVIPEKTTFIKESEYNGCFYLKEVQIPSGVKTIGKYAFRTCERMEKIEIPDSVTDIGEEAFRECRSLKEVVGGRKLQKLGGWVFEECKNLEKITLSSTLTEIGTGIFLGCEKLKTAGPETGEYNVKIGFSGNIPDRPFAGSRIESIVIPEKTTFIKESEYNGCFCLKEVQIPSGVKTIGKYAFRTCERMEKIEIPDSITEIGEEAFRECRSLKEVVGGRKLQKLGGWVFEECKNLEKITLSSTLTEIGTGIFLGCEKLKTAGPETGEYNVKIGFSGNIPDRPFAGSRIESIVIPEKTTFIKESEYNGCFYLKEVQIPSGVKTIGKYAFRTCERMEKIEIPDSVTEIGEEAFRECRSLKEVVGGRKLQKLGGWVFEECKNLEKITLSSTLTEIGTGIFSGCEKVTIYGYDGSVAQTYAQKNNIPFVILKDDPSSFDISNATISGLEKSYEYTGKTIKPTVKVILQSKTLTLNKDYKISYKNNKKVGTATITIKGIGKYTGTQTAQFQIAITPNLDNLKTSYTVEAGKIKKADTIKIAANGNLIVEGKLHAKEIYINKGGKLTIKADGIVESDSIISQGGTASGGGVLENTGLLKTYRLTVKNAGTVIMEGSAQTIVYDNFTMSTQSSKSSLKKGELFINGSLTLNGNSRNFVVEDNSDFKTIFCNAKDNKLVTKNRKYNLGTVCVANQKAYENLDLKAENYNSAVIYTKLKKDDQKRWTYTLSGKTLSIGASEWGVLIGRLYEQASENSAYTVTNSSLTVTERKFVESVASVWVNTIQTPINKGLNEYSSTKCQMEFKVGKHTCTLICNMDKYGSYATNGYVKLKVDNGKEQMIGMIAAGSIENFKAQAAVYLTEGYIKEYYKFTTGKVLKNITSKTNSAKLAGKFLEKMVDKYCFQSLKTSTTEEVKQLQKVFKIMKYLGKAV